MEKHVSATAAHVVALPADSQRQALARALFSFESEDKSAFAFSPLPYLDYIEAHGPGRPGYIEFFVEVITYFKRHSPAASIEGCIDSFSARASSTYLREQSHDRDVIKDNVLLVLGVWTLMHKYYVPLRNNNRHVLQAYCKCQNENYDEALGLKVAFTTLVSECGLLPHEAENKEDDVHADATALNPMNNTLAFPAFGLHESLDFECLTIKARTINAFKLTNLAGVRILWTTNISRHLLLSKHAQKYYLELFSLPCAIQNGPPSALRDMNIKAFNNVADEVLHSYSTLFSPQKPSFLHRSLGPFIGSRFWCWCLTCSSQRLRNRELKKLKESSVPMAPYDDALRMLMSERPGRWKTDTDVWRQNDFKHLWPRILALDSHLQKAKPWNFWVIFRDRRDTVQFWTFFFGTIILVLTFVQVLLGIAQVAGSFQ